MHEHTALSESAVSGAIMNPGMQEAFGTPHMTYDVVCTGADGKEKWHETIHNLVTTVGKNDIINQYFTGSSYTAAWYLGLKGTGTASTSDTMSSHSGWTEQTPYSGNRPAITFGTTSSGSNTATAVSYTITGTATIAGAFTANNSTAGGTTGTLYSAGDFSASRSVASGDTLNVTLTVSAS